MRAFSSFAAISFIALLSSMGASASADIVQVGSTFGAFIEDAGQYSVTALVFDGTQQTFTGINGLVTVTESQTDLGSGHYMIDISFASPGRDMFPVIPIVNSPYGGINIGGGGILESHPLNLTTPFDLVSAVSTFTRGDGNVFLSEDSPVHNPQPWDGFFPQAGFYPAFDIAGRDIERADIVFKGNVIAPMPSVALASAALFITLALLAILNHGLFRHNTAAASMN